MIYLLTARISLPASVAAISVMRKTKIERATGAVEGAAFETTSLTSSVRPSRRFEYGFGDNVVGVEVEVFDGNDQLA